MCLCFPLCTRESENKRIAYSIYEHDKLECFSINYPRHTADELKMEKRRIRSTWNNLHPKVKQNYYKHTLSTSPIL